MFIGLFCAQDVKKKKKKSLFCVEDFFFLFAMVSKEVLCFSIVLKFWYHDNLPRNKWHFLFSDSDAPLWPQCYSVVWALDFTCGPSLYVVDGLQL